MSHIDKYGNFVLHNVAIPFVKYSDRWIAPDIECSWKYYPGYIRFAQTDKPYAPGQYLMEIVGELPAGLRDKAAADYMQWDSDFLKQLETWHAQWKELKATEVSK